jgi:hypothetical protein
MTKEGAINEAVEQHRSWIEKRTDPDLQELRGKDLACWCKVDQPCHGDILIKLANEPKEIAADA